jgi:hypothetical protein
VDTVIPCFKEVSTDTGKVRSPYPKEFKGQVVALHRAGRTPAAAKSESTEESIRPGSSRPISMGA